MTTTTMMMMMMKIMMMMMVIVLLDSENMKPLTGELVVEQCRFYRVIFFTGTPPKSS